MAGFIAGRRINLRDFSNSLVEKNKADEPCMIFRTTFKQVGFLKPNLYDFSYTIEASRHLEAEFVRFFIHHSSKSAS